jgi:thiol-disulfide isomerase/thioredoxin
MKIIFIVLFTLISAKVFTQTHLRLILKASQPIDSVLVVHFTDKEFIQIPYKDTLELDFKIAVMDFYHINYVQKGKVYNAQLYLDPGNIEIFASIVNDKLNIDKVVGSPLFTSVENWKKQYAGLVKAKNPDELDSFLLKTYDEQIDNLFSFHIGSRYLNLHQNEKLKLYVLLPLIEKQNEELKKSFGFSILNERLRGILRNNNITLANFELLDLGNNMTHPAPPSSRFVVLDFWFVGCLPCIEDHKKINELLSLLKQKEVQIISISNDESFQQWKDYLKKNKYGWKQYKKPSGAESIISQLGITTYPTYILMNQIGEILFSTYSFTELLKQIK